MSYKCSKLRVKNGSAFCSTTAVCHRPLYSCPWVEYLYNQVSAGTITLNSIWPMSIRKAVKHFQPTDGQLKLDF